MKNCWDFEFLLNQIFRQWFIILRNWGIGFNYCWNYRPSKLLLHFFEYRLDQLNNKHTKIEVNSTIQYFDNRSEKKMSAKSLKFFFPPTTIWRPCKVFAKLDGNHLLVANIFKLKEYQKFGVMNMNKIWFTNKKIQFFKMK